MRHHNTSRQTSFQFQMPSYIWKTTQVDEQIFDWTISTSCFDFHYRWISIREAKIGHFHFHINSRAQRTQVWILEKRGWEEYFITRHAQGSMEELDIDDLVKSSVWIELALNARNGS
jgi:hypothetical protein